MSSENFYQELTPLRESVELLDPARYSDLPDDWHVIIADVRGSTAAIRSGRYKAVNITGVSAITAVVNAVAPIDIPFVFGGDGATLCAPESVLAAVRDALSATKRIADRAYGLELRTGIVPMAKIRAAGQRVLVARHQLSQQCTTTAFAGEGLAFAESLVKGADTQLQYEVEAPAHTAAADFQGLECRWQPIPSPRGETVALIVKALQGSIEDQAQTYREVFAEIESAYGGEDARRPVSLAGLRLAVGGGELWFEALLKSAEDSAWRRWSCWLGVWLQTLLGAALMGLELKIRGVPWGRYRRDLIANTDSIKFSGALQQVLSGTTAQRQRLTAFLESARSSGRLVYGLQVSPEALMTCLVQDYNGAHLHFLDGSQGGYALAAAQLKEQLRGRSPAAA